MLSSLTVLLGGAVRQRIPGSLWDSGRRCNEKAAEGTHLQPAGGKTVLGTELIAGFCGCVEN